MIPETYDPWRDLMVAFLDFNSRELDYRIPYAYLNNHLGQRVAHSFLATGQIRYFRLEKSMLGYFCQGAWSLMQEQGSWVWAAFISQLVDILDSEIYLWYAENGL